MRPFYTWILSPWFMTHRSPLKEPVQFIPDRFQILTWVSQQRHHAVAQADITQRPIDTGFSLRLSLLVAFVQGRLRTFRQDTFKRCQKDHRIEVLLDGVLAQATETFDFKDILEPVVVGLVAPAPAIDLIELCCRILSLIPQRGQQDFGFTRREREFHQAYLHIHRQLMLFDKGARGGSGRTRQGHDLFFQVGSPEVLHHAEALLRTANDNLAVSMYGRGDYAVISEEPIQDQRVAAFGLLPEIKQILLLGDDRPKFGAQRQIVAQIVKDNAQSLHSLCASSRITLDGVSLSQLRRVG